ncbi:beta-L-arabinofuranosidase domain-containing protein [Asanoa ishikariensis]|uniref:beta-L-arabinofuranosidase domain-containing protein n=1 Tax=Asanoa ishikariensis TaxID=137265 RepID=UPI00159F8C68|nr:beta-L-arabinofuranosidase domain-containing protein [Asanoa ishikariensis]
MSSPGPVAPTAAAACRLRPLPLGAARITGGVWAVRQRANRAAIRKGSAADVYEWLETAAWEYGREPDADLLRALRAVTPPVRVGQAGHLLRAAIAQVRATGDRRPLQVATEVADVLDGSDDSHPALAMALVELFRETDNHRYLDLARHIVDTHRPTRPGYLAAGAADVAIEQDDGDLLDALARDEPADSGPGGLHWAWRMLLATGEPHYADLAERLLDTSDPRTLASLDNYLATSDADGVQLHLYAPCLVTARLGEGQIQVAVEVEGNRIRARILDAPRREWTLSIRVPAWAGAAQLRVDGGAQRAWAGTYAEVVRAHRPGDTIDLVLR